jgi:nucleoside-diphosphate-sugar epimerase
MRITLSGSSSFVGTCLVTRLLTEGHKVRLIEGLERTIKYEFINRVDDQVFYTE